MYVYIHVYRWFVHHHVGGLENDSSNDLYERNVHRRTDGLEKIKMKIPTYFTRSQKYVFFCDDG